MLGSLSLTQAAAVGGQTSQPPPATLPGVNFPDKSDYLSGWLTNPTVFSNTTVWPRSNISTATLGFNLDASATATLFSENSSSNTAFSIRQTMTSKVAGTRYRRLSRFDVKASGRTWARMQCCTTDFSDGFNVFFQFSGSGQAIYVPTPNAASIATMAINSASITEIAGGFYRCEIDYYTDTASANLLEQMFIVLGNNEFGSHTGSIGLGFLCRNWTNVDITASLPVQGSVPVKVTSPIVWGPSAAGAALNNRLTVYVGTYTNQPISFNYQWAADGVDIAGATAFAYTVDAASAGKTITCKITPVNGVGAGATSASDGTIFDGVDHTQEWLTAHNFPTAADPTSASAPEYGSFSGAATNVLNMNFTPAGNVKDRATLDSLMFYTTMNGADGTSYPANAVTSPIDNPTSGSAYARVRRYPAGHMYDLHKFNSEGLRLGVIGKVNGKTATNGNIYSALIRPQTSFKPGMYAEFKIKGPSNPFAWTPIWLFTGDQVSPGRVAGSSNNPNYKPDGTHGLVNRAGLHVAAPNAPTNSQQYHEIDINDWWKNPSAPDVGHTIEAGLIVYGDRTSGLTVDRQYNYFLANSGRFIRSGAQNILSGVAWDDGFHTLAFNWRVLATTFHEGGTVKRSVTQMDYIMDGIVFRQEYYEYVNDLYVDPVTGQQTEPGMHILICGQSHPSFLSGVATSDISNWDSYAMTIQSMKIWQGTVDINSLTLPTNGVAAYATLNLSDNLPQANVLWTSNIDGKSTGTGTNNTIVRAVASDGTVLTVTGSTVSGTFTTTGNKTVTLTETPYTLATGNSLPVGLPTVTVVPITVTNNALVPITASMTDHAEDSTAQTTATFGGKAFSIGSPASDRLVVAVFCDRATTQTLSVNSCTIGGVAATKAYEYKGLNGTAETIISYWQAVVPTGTTATVSFGLSESANRMGCLVYSLYGTDGNVPAASAQSAVQVTGGASPLTLTAPSVTVPKGGAALLASWVSISQPTPAPTSTPANYSQVLSPLIIGGNTYSAGLDTTAGTRAYSDVWTGWIPQYGVLAVAAWKPVQPT